MAGSGTAQARLDRIVRTIAAEMVAEVCSCYIMRPGEILELFATEGLKAAAVHVTRLRVGEGLVGEIAARRRPLALADARAHPNFAYRPETGEEAYSALMGVPLLRGERVLGVLVVQNKAQRQYHDEEIEALETIAMVVAELAASGELVSPDDLRQATGALLPARLEGVRFNPGVAVGTVVLHRRSSAVRTVVAEDPGAEQDRLSAAVTAMQADLDAMFAATELAAGGEHRDVLETYRMFAADQGWLRRIDEAIRSGLTAEAAVERVRIDSRLRMEQVRDPYLRERLADIEDLADRLLRYLTAPGSAQGRLAQQLPKDAVVIARTMGPAELLDYDRSRLKALVLEEGSPTAHVAIIARALDIPVVGRVAGVLSQAEPDDPIVVDAENAQVFLRPAQRTIAQVEDSLRARAARSETLSSLRGLPAKTRDGTAISLQINAGLLVDLDHLDETAADGIGLYRTEIHFMVRSSFPSVAAQTNLYRRILAKAGARPVVFRLLDAGGDKRLPYWADMQEENPALGWRALRVALDRPALMRQQMRALIEAADGGPLTILLPMVAEVAEFDAARSIMQRELDREARLGRPLPCPLRVGAMLEVPSLAFQLPALISRCDFLAIGSNDLSQFLFAADRGNPHVANRFDTLSPPFLSFLRRVVRHCEAAGRAVSVCGEMASHPLEAMALVGIGVRTLSMTPSAVLPVKAMVRSLDLTAVEPYLASLLDLPDRSLRERLRNFAVDRGVEL
ncbi:MAG: phosphoenolpyruvate--protein phosphotransferase [Alphaproteobacteria bacterium]|nr:phosphoenolpyruvate--protein phosphotransferase [Alphaproteobacteria bacterium]